MLFSVKYITESEDFGKFFIEGDCIHMALELADNHLDEMLEVGHEILAIKAVLNFVEDHGEMLYDQNQGHCNECNSDYIGAGSCPTCTAHVCDPKMLMIFDCNKCGEHLKFANVAWSTVYCPKCKNTIERKNLRYVDNKWVYEMKGDEK